MRARFSSGCRGAARKDQDIEVAVRLQLVERRRAVEVRADGVLAEDLADEADDLVKLSRVSVAHSAEASP